MTPPFPAAFWIDRSNRTRLRLSGPDRAPFLHNLCTNDIKGLKVGHSVEAFITNLQGKTLGFGSVHARQDDLILSTEPESLEGLLPHFTKYGVFSEATWEDVTRSTREFHVVGRSRSEIPLGSEASGTSAFSEFPFLREGVTFIVEGEMPPALRDMLGQLPDLSGEARETLRIESGFPKFGVDLSSENLPQELARDSRSISFVKGCYLGQETVARLDALGHVNKILTGLRIEGSVEPAVGSVLNAGEETAGRITSVARASDGSGFVALGMVRVKHTSCGTRLAWSSEGQSGEALVAEFPMFAIAGEASNH